MSSRTKPRQIRSAKDRTRPAQTHRTTIPPGSQRRTGPDKMRPMKNEPQPPRKAAERRDDSLTETSFLPPPRERPGMLRGWENHIEVERNGDRLVIVGTNPDNAPPVDLLDYLKWYVWAPTLEREAKGIHLEFINAWSDSSLLAFIRKWGPI